MAHGKQPNHSPRGPEKVDGVPIYDRPETKNVSMFEGDVPRRKADPLAVAVLAVGAVVVSVGLVWLAAIGIAKLTSSGTGGPSLDFEAGKHYALQLRVFSGDEARLDAERLKQELVREGNTTVNLFLRKGKGKVVVTVGRFTKGEEAEARLLYRKFIEAYPDARFIEVP